MSKLDQQNEDFAKVLSEYHKTGKLSEDFYKHLDAIRRYTSALPQFKNYTEDWKQMMEEKAQDRAVDALLKGKYNNRKKNPVSFFGNVYYNTYLNAIRDTKKRVAREAKGDDSTPANSPKYRKPEPVEVIYDPVGLFSPFISWILIEDEAEKISQRFYVFALMHYPELLPEDTQVSQSLLENYRATFPDSKRSKRTPWYLCGLMRSITELRRKCNTHHNMSNPGLRNNLLGLKNIIEKRLKQSKVLD